MSERPKGAADPDSTVMLPAEGMGGRPDDEDATVMIPAAGADDDATVMIPGPRSDDGDETVMIPVARPDDDATVMIPAARADDEATVMTSAAPVDEPDPEATIAIPTPGRRREVIAPAPPAAPVPGSAVATIEAGELGGLNALVAAANPVLGIAVAIRHALKHPDPAGLKTELSRSLDAFEAAARAGGFEDEVISSASVALCSLVDESAGSTPWGTSWLDRGLHHERHHDGVGGSTFFDLLELRLADPAGSRELIEFFYICLALGFEGRYRDASDGRQVLTELRAKMLARLRAERPSNDGELSNHWRGVAAPARRPAGALGLWVAASAVALTLAVVYIAFSSSLASLSDPVARELAQLKAAPIPDRLRQAAATQPSPGVAEYLAGEIGRGEIAIVDGAGSSTIVIRSDRLFASGSARLESGIEAVVLRVAEALDRVPGTIVVTGHTDDVPIRTARFPSNWELSNERAASVMKLMAGKLKEPGRLRAEGLADAAPSAPNDSAANRARNRRVEIDLRGAK